MVFLGIVCKIILKYSKKLLDYKVKNTKTYIIIRVTMSGNKKKGLQSEDDPWPFGLGFEVRPINPQCKTFTDYRNRKLLLQGSGFC